MLGVIPREARKPPAGEERRPVGGENEAVPVDHRLRRRGSPEPVRLAHDPGGQHATAAPAGDEQVVRVHVTTLDHGIHARHQIIVVLTRIGVVDEVAELAAVTRRAARVHVQHDVAGGRVQLHLGREPVTVVGEGSAVDLENQRVLARGIEARRLGDPGLDPPSVVGGLGPDLLDLCQPLVREEVVVECGETPRGLEAGAAHGHIRRVIRPGEREGEAAVRCDRERASRVRPTEGEAAQVRRQRSDAPIQRHERELRVPFVVVLEEQARAVRTPRRVLDVPVQAGRHAADVPAVAVHHVQLGDLIALVPVIEAHVRDHRSVR